MNFIKVVCKDKGSKMTYQTLEMEGVSISGFDALLLANLNPSSVVAWSVDSGSGESKMLDLSSSAPSGSTVDFIASDSSAALEVIRHDAAHVLAQAIKELYPDAKITIGPAIDNGFYYDAEFNEPISNDDLPRLEAKMQEIISRNLDIKRDMESTSSDRIF